MKVEVAVPGSPSLIVLIISGRKATLKNRAHELCGSRGGRPGLPTPNSPYGLFGRKATLKNRAHKLCESRGTRRGLPAPNSPYGLCGRKATLEREKGKKKGRYCLFRAQELCESRGGRPGLPVPDSPYGPCGRKATLNCSITEVMSCVKVEVAVLGSPSLTVSMVSLDVKQH